MQKKNVEKETVLRDSAAGPKQPRQAKLVLEDGSEYSGWSFGKPRSQAGEVVFNTGMTSYTGFLSDPASRGQLLVAAYPLIGNAGVPVKPKTLEIYRDEYGLPLHFESDKIQVSGLVVSEVSWEPSHFSSGASLAQWLDKNNVPGVSGIDTRALTQRLREQGPMRGKILVEGKADVTFDSAPDENPAAAVSCNAVSSYLPPGKKRGEIPRIVLVDLGAKTGIFRALLSRNVEVIRVPWNHDLHKIEYDGLVLSNGPGDPKAAGRTIAMVRRAFQAARPVFGICLGSLVMALAAGADTFKLPSGHRGQNQPCVEAGTKRCYITTQNHGYAVRSDTLPKGWEPWFINNNDGTVEGIRSLKGPFSGVQFYPDGSPGPGDTEFLFDRFLDEVLNQGRKH